MKKRRTTGHLFGSSGVGVMAMAALVATGAPAGAAQRDKVALPTLDGGIPLIIGHRGLPGLYLSLIHI